MKQALMFFLVFGFVGCANFPTEFNLRKDGNEMNCTTDWEACTRTCDVEVGKDGGGYTRPLKQEMCDAHNAKKSGK